MNNTVSGFGKVNVDMIFRDMPRLPNLGEEVYTDKFSLCLGGGIAATLLNVGRLGVETNIVTMLSDDMFSSFARNEFIKAGANPVNLYTGSSIPVNLTSVILTPGERTFVSYGMAEDGADEQTIYQSLKGSTICGMQAEYLNVYRRLHEDGTLLVLDTGYIEDMSVESMEEYLKIADYYTPNRKEALKITGCDNEKDAAKRLSAYFKDVIIKLDKDGCLIYNEKGFTLVKSIDEYECADATGAGDAFLSGFLDGLYKKADIEQCVLYGNLTGGKCVSAVGCTTAYLTENELLNLAEKYSSQIIRIR
ncbi:MAG: carbohydrate kinase family protein [Clostridia bacterium]|nr:carbohydrate kinase family protein [Clostridia bacterium]